MSDQSLSTIAQRGGSPDGRGVLRRAALVAWMVAGVLPGCQRSPAAQKAEPAPKPVPKRVDAVDAPPPPPPEPEAPSEATAAGSALAAAAPSGAPGPRRAATAQAAGATTQNDTAKNDAAQKKQRPSPCDATCTGTASAELQRALRTKAGQARSCYERALTHNSELQGSLAVQVRIGPGGEVCAATLAKDKLGDGAVTGCVVQRFRGGPFPKPSGGCVDVEVPINFVPRQAG